MGSENLNGNDNEELILINIIENIVKEKVDEVIDTFNMCVCKKCRLNACAIALNQLQPRYVTTTKGALMAHAAISKLQYQTSVTVEVAKALLKVKEHPFH